LAAEKERKKERKKKDFRLIIFFRKWFMNCKTKATHTDGKNITKDVMLLTLHYKVGSRPCPQTFDKAGRSVREKNSSLLGPFIS
jgi:hypothetical protein